jgi:hypothetical protein
MNAGRAIYTNNKSKHPVTPISPMDILRVGDGGMAINS